MKRVLVLTAGLLLAASTAFAQLGTTSPRARSHLTLAAEAGLVVNTATTTLTESGSGANFQPYTGTTVSHLLYPHFQQRNRHHWLESLD